ncbi:MAG: DMT family transporter [Bacteroidales bacterium]|jgi:drug/metabolite transporter (DMT)-like permease|nr:DMT family transporter [Bacteroidales bacterium]
MFQSHLGEYAALLTAVFWTITAVAFESVGKKIGSLTTNLLRLFLAFIFIGIYSQITRGSFIPFDASAHQWIWLSLSGFVGFVIGDLLLFEAYVVVGSRISMLIMSLTPPITAFFGWIILGEVLTGLNFLGMFLTIFGIMIVVLDTSSKSQNNETETIDQSNVNKKKIKLTYPIIGLLLAFGGAVGQGAGLVLSKYGMQDFDPFAATQIRVMTGFVSFTLMFVILKRWRKVFEAIKNKNAMTSLSIGAIFGPFLGVSFSLLSVQHTTTGVASTIMSIVPILIIPPAIVFFKEKITTKEVIGSIIAVGGVALFFM